MFGNYNQEFIKQTVLKHEDTFRHQVRELHRLYGVQKTLMSTMRSDTRRNKEIYPRVTSNINNDDVGIIKGLDLTRSIEDTSCGDSSGIQDDQTGNNDVELTLSIGPSTSKRRPQQRLHQIGGNETKGSSKTNSANSSSTLYSQDSKRPHWLFQDLSLNRT